MLVPPGSPIPLDDVAAFFGVSLIPVREALKTLLGEGLLEHQPRLGYTVTALSQAELDELYVVRGALEAAALEAAVRQATPADDARAMAVHEGLGAAVAAQDAAGFQRASREFHEALLSPCRMPRLLHMLEIAWNLTEPVQTMMRVSAEDRAELRADHEEMLDAFVARDAALAHSRRGGTPQPAHRLHLQPQRRLTRPLCVCIRHPLCGWVRGLCAPVDVNAVLPDIRRYTVQDICRKPLSP